MRRALAIVMACGPALFFATSARAEDPRALRELAEAEMATGNFAEACPMLVEAYAADHDAATLFAQARCFDGAMKLASAHAAYAAALKSPALGDDERRIAGGRLAELGPRLSRITVRIPADVRIVPGVRVTFDGVEVPSEAWDVPHPRDAGKVSVAIAVPGRPPYTTLVAVPIEGGDEIVDVPAAGFANRVSAAAGSTAPRAVRVRLPSSGRDDYVLDTSTFGPWQVAGGITFVTGTVAAGVGLVVGLMAKADHNRAQNNCTDNVCNDNIYVQAAELARDQGDVGTAIGLAGLGVMGVGAGLYLFGPRPSKPPMISVAPRGLGLSLGGSF